MCLTQTRIVLIKVIKTYIQKLFSLGAFSTIK